MNKTAKRASYFPASEQRIADLAAEYSERIVAGENVSIQEYLHKCINEQERAAFKKVANLTRFIAAAHGIGNWDSQEQAAEVSIEAAIRHQEGAAIIH